MKKKTNISGLMSMISTEEKKYNNLTSKIKSYVYNTTIQELDGTVNIIENYKKEFENTFIEQKNSLERLSKLKATLYDKNNEFKLSDGRSIQTAISDNTYLRQMKASYEYILNFRDTKRRVTEVNNSYFECKEINFDIDKITKELENIDNNIQKTDFEISKLNSIEFEIEL